MTAISDENTTYVVAITISFGCIHIMKNQSFSLPFRLLVLLCLNISNCAPYMALTTDTDVEPPDKSHLTYNDYKYARLTLQNSVIEGEISQFSLSKRSIIIMHNSYKSEYFFEDMKKLEQSNTNAEARSAIVGALSGLSIPLLIGISSDNTSNNNSEWDLNQTNLLIMLGVVTVSLGTYLGIKVGSQVYTNWQEFDLTPYRKEKLSLGLKPMRGGFGIGLRIPLRR